MRMTPQSAADHEARVKAGKDSFKRKLGLVAPEPVETYPERRSKADEVAEKKLHEKFQQWCNLNEIDVIHAPMHRPSWLPSGHPDFTCFKNGRVCFVEFKCANAFYSKDYGLSEDQMTCRCKLERHGSSVKITPHLADAIKFTLENLKG